MELFFNISNKFGNMENHEFLVKNMGNARKISGRHGDDPKSVYGRPRAAIFWSFRLI